MASLYRRKDSPFWWIRLKGEDDQWLGVSTKLLVDDPRQTKQARARCAATTARELSEDDEQKKGERWQDWVAGYLRTHCQDEETLAQYQRSWAWLRSFFMEFRIYTPRQVTVAHVYQYIDWRVAQGKKKSTALVEIKVLRILMQFAFRNGWIQGNPCVRLGIRREAPKQKPELTDADIESIYEKLAGMPAWMAICFTIALHTGCRISETRIAFKDIDFNEGTITFASPKGGAGKAYSIPMPAALAPLLKRIRDTGATHTVDLPHAYGQYFSKFFIHKLKRPDLTFHCTRVTRVTRLLRAGVDERTAMLLVNHSSAETSRIYQRMRVGDVRHAVDKVRYPVPASLPMPESPST